MKKNAKSLEELKQLEKIKDDYQVASEIRQFLQRKGAYSHLRTLVNVFAPQKGRDLTLHVNVGGGSYTDGKVVVIGLFEFLWKLERDEIFACLKAMTAHEVGHVLHSDFNSHQLFLSKVAKYFKDKYEVDERISKQIAHGIYNSIEDGGIGGLMGARFPGIIPNIQFLRSHWWEAQPVDQVENDFSIWMAAIVTLATTGMWPKNFDPVKHERVYQEINKIAHWIQGGVMTNNFDKCLDFCWEIILQCEDFIMEEIKRADDMAQFMNDLMEALESQTAQFENGKDKSGDGSKQIEQLEENEANGKGSASSHIDPRLLSSERLKEMAKHCRSNGSENQDGNSGESTSSGSSEEEGKEANSSKDEGEKGSEPTDGQTSESDKGSRSNATNEDLSQRPSNRKMKREDVFEEEIRPATPETYSKIIAELQRRQAEANKQAIENIDKFDEKNEKIEEARRKQEEMEQARKEAELKEVTRQFDRSFDYHSIPFEARPVRLTPEITAKGKLLNKEFDDLLNREPDEDYARYRKGVLDTSSLWRLSTNERRLFNRRTPDEYTCAVSILIDGSGSMGSPTTHYGKRSSRFEDALRAGAIIEEALRGLVPLDITVFTTGSAEVVHHELKDFDEQSPINYCWSFYQHGNGPFWGNSDGYSIAIAGNKLRKRPEDQKILFVISDGLPAFTNGVEETRKAVRNLKQKGVKVIGIGVGEEAIQCQDQFLRMYEKESVLIETEKLTDYLIRFLRKLLA